MNEKTKKIVKIELRIFGIFIIISLLAYLYRIVFPRPLSNEYYSMYRYGTAIEEYYSAPGHHTVKSIEIKDPDSLFGKFKIWYPEDLINKNEKLPLIIACNGTFMSYGVNEPYFEHFASWGFVIVGNNDRFGGDGKSAIKSLNIVLEQNSNIDSVLFDKIDMDKIGATGYSRGGSATFNAYNNFDEGKYIRTIFDISPVNKEYAKINLCPYEYENIKIPIAIITSTGYRDYDEFMPIEKLVEMYNNSLSEHIFVARREHAGHVGMDVRTAGYTTAWFLHLLCGDEQAGKCFFGDDADILNNKLWEDVAHRWR